MIETLRFYTKEEKQELRDKIKLEIKEIVPSKREKVLNRMIDGEKLGYILIRTLQRIRDIKRELAE